MGEPSGQETALAATHDALAGDLQPHPDYGIPTRSWVYYSLLGDVVSVKCEFGDGETLRTATLTKNGVGLKWAPCPLPMPLWGIEQGHGDAVCLCLDEESAESARYLLPNHTCLAPFSPHPEETDLSPLKHRAVLIWPCVGQDGKPWVKAIKPLATAVKLLKPPPEKSIGWGPTEAIERDHWGATDTIAWLLKLRVGPPHVERAAAKTVIAPATDFESNQFQILGHAEGNIYVVPSEGGQVLEVPMHGLGRASLPILAPLEYWQSTFPGSQGVDWTAAASAIIRQAYRCGVHDPSRIRGRGAWWDDGRNVLHLGDRLLVGEKIIPPRNFKSRFTYEMGAAIAFADAKPLSDQEAQKFPDLCSMLSWHRPISANWLSGWCVIAPICGALEWRPHLFLTGQAQSGKTWCMENIIARMIGEIGLFLAATTSEPGIRRAMRCDARPLFIDELEGTDSRSIERIKAIFHLFRYASSETGAQIMMGRPGGGTETFRPRFSGTTSAIGSLLSDYADVTRNSTCSLKVIANGNERERQFGEIRSAQRSLLTPAYIAGMQARIVQLVPIIRDNAQTFATAGAYVLGARRLGDQIGALMAGRYACQSSNRITDKAATEWLMKQNWEEEREIIQDTDGPACLARIMQHKISVDGLRGKIERSVGELVSRLHGTADDLVSAEVADATLGRNGILAKDRFVWISNTHTSIAEMLRGTQWSMNWGERLRTIPGAASSGDPVRFPGGSKTRAWGVPFN